jgi:hypothetical protein
VVRRLALERGGGSPEGCRGWLLDGPLMVFWVVGSALGRDHAGCGLQFLGVFVYLYYF